MLKELPGAPAMRPLLARAALASIRRGGATELPSTVYGRADVLVSPSELADYDRVCGFGLSDELPPTYPHLLGFPLQMKLMTDADFPFPPMGTVHVANRITVHRPLSVNDRLELRVRAENLREHPRGRQFDVLTETYVDGELVWHEVSTYLRRGGSAESGVDTATPDEGGVHTAAPGDSVDAGHPHPSDFQPTAVWRIGEDAGRRYAEVSGDANPIHLYALTAKLFGFPRAIAHGMWTKARCLASLAGTLQGAYTVDVRFRKPVLLPSKVAFGTTATGGHRDFELRNAKNDKPHILGSIDEL